MRGEVGAIQLRAFCLVLSLKYWFFAIEKALRIFPKNSPWRLLAQLRSSDI
jgi:hypothetical protein